MDTKSLTEPILCKTCITKYKEWYEQKEIINDAFAKRMRAKFAFNLLFIHGTSVLFQSVVFIAIYALFRGLI